MGRRKSSRSAGRTPACDSAGLGDHTGGGCLTPPPVPLLRMARRSGPGHVARTFGSIRSMNRLAGETREA